MVGAADQVYADLYLLNPTTTQKTSRPARRIVNAAMAARLPRFRRQRSRATAGCRLMRFSWGLASWHVWAPPRDHSRGEDFTWLDSSWTVVQSHPLRPEEQAPRRDSTFVNTDSIGPVATAG